MMRLPEAVSIIRVTPAISCDLHHSFYIIFCTGPGPNPPQKLLQWLTKIFGVGRWLTHQNNLLQKKTQGALFKFLSIFGLKFALVHLSFFFFLFFFLSLALNEVVILQRFKSFFFPFYCGFLFIIDLLRYGVFHLFVTILYLCGRRRFRHVKRIRSIKDIIL